MIALRPMSVESARLLAELWAVTFEQAYAAVHSRANLRAYCAANYTPAVAEAVLRDPRVVCRAAFRGDAAVGFHLVKHHACPLPPGAAASELKQLYVLASEYGAGTGRRLFDDAAECIRDAGRAWVWLSVSDRNHRARAFYGKLGFTPVGAGPLFHVGSDRLTSTILVRNAG